MNIQLQDVSHGPIYLQVRHQIENHIKNGQLTPGQALLGPGALAQQLAVDKGEIQRAYFELEQFGLVRKKTAKDFLGKEKITYSIA
jgi:DNA-binding transcriptional regulator YhcF (GntR family)